MNETKNRSEGLIVEGQAVVTAGVPEAAYVGQTILRDGGNAFDAAVAACLVETTALPMKCGLAGDVVAFVWEAGKKPRALLSIGGGAQAIASGAQYTETGPCSVGIPGAPDGYSEIASLGRMALSDLAAPAIDLARSGTAWLPIAVTLTKEAEPLLRQYNGAISYLPNKQLPNVGDPLVLTKLADAIELFVADGPAVFEGAIGEALVAKVQSTGGFLTMSDMATRPARWEEPESSPVGNGCHLFATPSPTHGRDLIAAVKLLDNAGMNTLKSYHQVAGRPKNIAAGTSVVCCADATGNAIVVVHSNSFPQYGSCVVVDDFDLVLSNRPGRGFDHNADPTTKNAPAVGRRPKTTLHAWMLETPEGHFVGASPGGQNQMPWNLQTLAMLLDGERDLEFLATCPRWGLQKGGVVDVEEGHPLAGDADISIVPPLTLRSVNQIIEIPSNGSLLRASADPRTGACATAIASTEVT